MQPPWASLAGALLLAATAPACTRQPAHFSPVGGLSRSDATFVMTGDMCELSVLFDKLTLRIPQQKDKHIASRFTVSGGEGRPLAIDVRGTLDAQGPIKAILSLNIAGQATDHRLNPSPDGGFFVHQQAKLSDGGETPFVISATLSGENSEGEAALLSINTLDALIGPERPCK